MGQHESFPFPADPVTNLDRNSLLPPLLRLLCIGTDEPSWVNLTLQLDAEGCSEPQYRWVASSQAALTLLRDESFDCVFIGVDLKTHRVGQDVPLELLRSIRAGGCSDPVILISSIVDDTWWNECHRHDCELLVTDKLWDSSAIVSLLKQAIFRSDLRQETHRLSIAQHRRLIRERDEAEHLLNQQRQILAELQLLARQNEKVVRGQHVTHTDRADASASDIVESQPPAGAQFAEYYAELLRSYVIMGSGSLAGEIAKFAEILVLTGLTPREAMQLHLQHVEELVRGLGSRSTRHVIARADLLALELMIHVGESIQRLNSGMSAEHREALRGTISLARAA